MQTVKSICRIVQGVYYILYFGHIYHVISARPTLLMIKFWDCFAYK